MYVIAAHYQWTSRNGQCLPMSLIIYLMQHNALIHCAILDQVKEFLLWFNTKE